MLRKFNFDYDYEYALDATLRVLLNPYFGQVGNQLMTENNNPTYSNEELLTGLVTQISAYIEQYHGGSVELVSFKDDKVKVKLGGACIGCPLSTATLKGWVEGTIHQFFPNVKVIGVEE